MQWFENGLGEVQDVKAIILAAGRGSRMKEKTKILPKCLTVLWGKTLLEWQLAALDGAGIKDIAVITGYHADEIRKRMPELSYFHNAAWMETNMVSTLLEAEEWLSGDECIVSYADIVYTKHAVSALMDNSDDLAVTYYTKFLTLWQERFENPLDDIETFKIDKQLYLAEIGQKAKSLKEIEGQYMGLLTFTPTGWRRISKIIKAGLPKPIEKMDMTGLLSYLLLQGMHIRAVPYDEFWLEVDSQSDLGLYESWGKERYKELDT